jgi:hypothetical protein
VRYAVGERKEKKKLPDFPQDSTAVISFSQSTEKYFGGKNNHQSIDESPP